jgi:hypothetical protein
MDDSPSTFFECRGGVVYLIGKRYTIQTKSFIKYNPLVSGLITAKILTLLETLIQPVIFDK